MKRKLTLAVVTLMMIGLSSAAAYADTVTLTLTAPVGYVPGSSGGTITYDATVSAPITNGADIYLVADSSSGDSPLSIDDNDFFANFPVFLSPGQSFTGDLFTVSVPAATAPGSYFGFFTLQGGAYGGAQDSLATVNFTTTVTPEPSSFLLLGTGFSGLICVARRRLQK